MAGAVSAVLCEALSGAVAVGAMGPVGAVVCDPSVTGAVAVGGVRLMVAGPLGVVVAGPLGVVVAGPLGVVVAGRVTLVLGGSVGVMVAAFRGVVIAAMGLFMRGSAGGILRTSSVGLSVGSVAPPGRLTGHLLTGTRTAGCDGMTFPGLMLRHPLTASPASHF